MQEAKFTWFPKLTATVAKVPEEQRGAILWALAQYGTYGIEPELEWPLDAIFESLREDIDNSKRAISSGGTGGDAETRRVLQATRKTPLQTAKPPFPSSQTSLAITSKRGFWKPKTGVWKMPNPNQTIPSQTIPSQRRGSSRPQLTRFAPTARRRATRSTRRLSWRSTSRRAGRSGATP